MVTVATDAVSEDWRAIAQLRPGLKANVRVHHHTYRGQSWYVVRDPSSAQYFRFPESTYLLIGAFDGKRTLEDVLTGLQTLRQDDAPTRDDIAQLVASLRAANLLDLKLRPSTAALLDKVARKRHKRWLSTLARPFSIRLPLFDPNQLLERVAPYANWLFGGFGVLLWLACVVAGLVVLATEWRALSEHAITRLPDPTNLILLYAVYPVIKTVHELAHGLAVKRWNGAVHEMGLMLLVLVPVPYVDASAASAFPRRLARITVGAAGVVAESTLAGLGMVVWFFVEPGVMRDIAFHVALIGGVSTLLVNGNPLLRFDGYHVLADVIEIPGLARRSSAYYAYLAKRYLLGVTATASPVRAMGERRWFLAYAPAAFLYRMVVMLSIVMLLLDLVPVVGVALAMWAVFSMLGLPLVKQGWYLLTHSELNQRRLRALLVMSVTLVALAATLMIRVPSSTSAQGIIAAPANASIRAETDGFVSAVLREQGDWVRAHEQIASLENLELGARVRELEARVAELEARRLRDAQASVAKASISATEVKRARAELREARARTQQLNVTTPVSGRLNLAYPQDMFGRFVHKGDLIAHVLDRQTDAVQAVVSQRSVDRVRSYAGDVLVRLEHTGEKTHAGRVIALEPAAARALPSALLGTAKGGDVMVDARDQSGTQALDSVFVVDIQLTDPAPGHVVGSRAYLRFEHEAEALAHQVLRIARQQFLRHWPN